MLRIVTIFVLLTCNVIELFSQSPESFSIHSTATGDTYQVKVMTPEGFSSAGQYHLVYIADGSIGLGEYVSGTNENWKASQPSNLVIITIGHSGDWQSKRARDFIPSDAGGFSSKEFGQAKNFYAFLKSELMPRIAEKFKSPKTKVFIGHSFGGLFALYAALKNEKIFDRYFAISPSVWANHYELMKIEQGYAARNKTLAADIHIYVGSLEFLNKVLSSSRKFEKVVRSRNYKDLQLQFTEIRNANHYSVRKPAIDRIFSQLKDL